MTDSNGEVYIPNGAFTEDMWNVIADYRTLDVPARCDSARGVGYDEIETGLEVVSSMGERPYDNAYVYTLGSDGRFIEIVDVCDHIDIIPESNDDVCVSDELFDQMLEGCC